MVQSLTYQAKHGSDLHDTSLAQVLQGCLSLQTAGEGPTMRAVLPDTPRDDLKAGENWFASPTRRPATAAQGAVSSLALHSKQAFAAAPVLLVAAQSRAPELAHMPACFAHSPANPHAPPATHNSTESASSS